ncbi:MAG: ATP-binding cassette domain-containing protein [Chloroflexi bacterium]|nr:ATP-binding cassette domain-containing protein [Chloroflexota bacterium]
MSTFVKLDNLRKQYSPPDGPYAVGPHEGVNLEILGGEIFSLLGPNGAGKTTIISMMSGLLTPTGGDVTIGGFSITKQPLDVKKQIGVVPQDLALYPNLSARQNLNLFGTLYGLSGKNLSKRTDEVLEFIDLKDRAKDKISEYSGGMKRRVNIGVGLMHRPKMLFLDEPTVAIDPQSRRNILDTVKELNRQGMTVLYTTHYMEEAQELSNRIGIIDHGQIIALGSLAELVKGVGEFDIIRLTLPEPPQTVIDRLAAIPEIERAETSDGEVRLIARNGRQKLPEAIRIINEAGVALHGVEIQEPNLEAVFLQLTGRALRD